MSDGACKGNEYSSLYGLAYVCLLGSNDSKSEGLDNGIVEVLFDGVKLSTVDALSDTKR